MNKFHVVFISAPGIGNFVPTVEFARHLNNHDPRFIVTILMIEIAERPIVNAYIQSCVATHTSINFINLPPVDPPSPDEYQTSLGYICLLIAKHKLHVKNAIEDLMSTESPSDSDMVDVRVAGLVVDMFCTSMIDVAKELGIPCYLYFTSPVSFLGFMLYFPTLDGIFTTEFVDSDSGLMVPKDSAAANTSELTIPGFANPLPHLMLPNRVLYRKQEGYFWFLHHARRYKETKGMVVNTFRELEPYAIDSVSNGNGDWPPIYPIGPVLDLVGPAQWHPERAQHDSIVQWLDNQPPSSVVFLCFGSMGSLSGAQLREIAVGLERSGFRFLWSIREPPKRELDLPGEYKNGEEIEMLPQGYKETKGIVVNTFRELESYAIDSVSNGNDDWPPIYPIGPVLDLVGPAQWHPQQAQHGSIMQWLDNQPPSSVVFLCFGSMGSLSEAQLREIAVGLERSGFRFLWSIREPPKMKLDLPGEYTNVEEIEMLPPGFVDRSRRAGTGLVCGWVPQALILSHQAIGGFVSHCGWNSILESIWYGVPIATWPLYAEQQLNAFELVTELELAVEIRADYRKGSDLVSPEELERALRRLMKGNDEVRRKMREMKQKSRVALMPNGSSYKSLASLIEELTAEIAIKKVEILE
ncbi:UDP-glucuronosyl/UDP-glucosyltransferase - like 10 [Theobroma cacao]|nr:UDP-glucuronosyl/UDP-glucosyltransferase - like 10 [Theobroma cacao]